MGRKFILLISLIAGLSVPTAALANISPAICLWRILDAKSRADLEFSWPTQTLQIERSGDQLSLAGAALRMFEIPVGHHPGFQHEAMYEVTRDGSKRIVKVFDPESKPLSLKALLMAGEVGAPTLFNAGRIVTEKGDTLLFIEMEVLFEGLRSLSFKKMNADVEYLPLFQRNSSAAREIVDTYITAYHSGLIPDFDVDFLIADGRARPIDVMEWRVAEPSTTAAARLRAFREIINRLRTFPETSAKFKRVAAEQIENSKVLTADEKEYFLSLLKG